MDQEFMNDDDSNQEQEELENDGDYSEDMDGMDEMDDVEILGEDEQDEDGEEEPKEKMIVSKIDMTQVSEEIKKFWREWENIKMGQYFKLPPAKEVPKSVCAKIIKHSDKIIECYDCRMDPTCIICMECFENGNHEGHRYVVKSAGGGCCDCGDPEAWNEKGFCNKHTGQFQDFQIPEIACQQFNHSFDGIVFHYFRLVLKNDDKKIMYAKKIIEFLKKLNDNNPYYNKLTALMLKRKFTDPYLLPEKLRKNSILENILTFDISEELINDWFNLFTLMFPYYPFKLDILSHYIRNFGMLVNGSNKANQCASSISCQLITSYKLVEQYSCKNKIGLGQKTVVPTTKSKIENYYFMLLHDLKYITELTGNAPLAYWRMHIKAGLGNIFDFHTFLRKDVKKNNGNFTDTQKIAEYIDFIQVEHRLIELMSHLVKILPGQELGQVVKFLWEKCETFSGKLDPEQMPIFRPEERSLAIALFKYFNFSLNNINEQSVKFLAIEILKVDQASFQVFCVKTLKRMMRTYFHYSKCMAETGFAQTMYPYLYFYKIKSRMMSCLDILCIKILLLMLDKPYPLIFSSITEFSQQKINTDDMEKFLKEKRTYFEYSISLITFLYASCSSEIFWAYEIDKNCGLYESQMENILIKAFVEKKGEMNQQFFKTIKQSLLHPEAKFPNQWVKHKCRLNKERKTIIMENMENMGNMGNMGANQIGINFHDFWTNIVKEETTFDNPEKTYDLLNESSRKIFSYLWNDLTLESFKSIVTVIYPDENAGVETFLKRLIPLYYIMKRSGYTPSSIIEETIIKFQKMISSDIAKMLHLGVNENENEDMLEEKKKRMQQLKAEKLKKFKAKQNLYLEKRISEEKIPEEKMPEAGAAQLCEKQEMFCCICKNDDPENFVYISKIDVRNHEKLLGFGEGLQCLSVFSCRHIFDYKCIKARFKENQIINSIVCPLCKTSGNIIIPLNHANPELNANFETRMIQILFSLKDGANLYEQLFKSFYHYVLLCTVNFSNAFTRRSKQYRAIFKLLTQNITEQDFKQFQQKFADRKISRDFPSHLVEEESNKIKKQNFLTMILGLSEENDEEGIRELIGQTSEHSFKKGNNKRQQKNKESEMKNENENENEASYSDLFIETMEEVISEVKRVRIGGERVEKSHFVAVCLATIFDDVMEIGSFTSPMMQEKKIFREMPDRYTAIGTMKKCKECGNIAKDLVLCLLCDWTGCMDCEDGFPGLHMKKKHGNIGAVIKAQKGIGCYISSDIISQAGSLYIDQFGNPLKLSMQWDQFELNRTLLEKMETNLKNDEIP